jgi:hypothetical protein
MRPSMERNEVHLINTTSNGDQTLLSENHGHNLSTDCWCEPVKVYWYTNKHGITMLVVEHTDDGTPHSAVLYSRETGRDWITVLFDSLFR